MRTTIDLDPKAYAVAKSIAQHRNLSLGKVISELILAEPKPSDDDLDIRISPITGFATYRAAHKFTPDEIKAFLEDDE